MSSDPVYLVSPLLEKKRVAENCYDLFFKSEIDAIPGQFLMIWIPGIDEIPMSVSHIERDRIGITVKIVGKATEALCSLQLGKRIRIRGPYGGGFDPKGKEALLVAGGVGAAPLLPLAFLLRENKSQVEVIIGAKSEKEIVNADSFRNAGAETRIATDDGSSGFQGTASQLFAEVLGEKKFDSIYCCGPESMITSVMKIAESKKIWGQAAIERFMKCGIGICGSCAIKNKLVCSDGPVFNFDELRKLNEFNP